MAYRILGKADDVPIFRRGLDHSRDMESVAGVKVACWRIGDVMIEFAGDTVRVQRIVEKSTAYAASLRRVLRVQVGVRNAVIVSLIFGEVRKCFCKKIACTAFAIFQSFITIKRDAFFADSDFAPDVEGWNGRYPSRSGVAIETVFELARSHDASLDRGAWRRCYDGVRATRPDAEPDWRGDKMPEQRKETMMRELDDEERQVLRELDAGVSTPHLIAMVRDLAEILRGRGHVVQASVAEIAADRLSLLSTGIRA